MQLDVREYNCFKEISESCLTNSIFHLSSPQHFPLIMTIIREFYLNLSRNFDNLNNFTFNSLIFLISSTFDSCKPPILIFTHKKNIWWLDKFFYDVTNSIFNTFLHPPQCFSISFTSFFMRHQHFAFENTIWWRIYFILLVLAYFFILGSLFLFIKPSWKM